MMDIENMLKLADELDIKYELNSKTPGFFILDRNGNKREVTVEELLGIPKEDTPTP